MREVTEETGVECQALTSIGNRTLPDSNALERSLSSTGVAPAFGIYVDGMRSSETASAI